MPARQIDHLVITVLDLGAASTEFEKLGFTLTPKAEHPWGTSNRLIQFADRSFIEVLTLDRPHLLFEHDATKTPPIFSFGAYNRDFLARGCRGIAMCALSGSDSSADVARFAAAGLQTFAPFDFGRKATLPEGTVVEVAFSLAFATHPRAADFTLFTCHNRYPENFWKPAFQHHANGATGIATVRCAAPAEARSAVATYIAAVAASTVDDARDHARIPCSPHAFEVVDLDEKPIVNGSPLPTNHPYAALTGFSVRGTARRDTVDVAGTRLSFS